MHRHRIWTCVMILALTGCSASTIKEEDIQPTESTQEEVNMENDSEVEVIENSVDGEHAIAIGNGEEASYTNIKVIKTGEASGDEADFYGENAAIFASDGANLNLDTITVETNGTHANAIFSYGEGTTVTVRDSIITTSGNCSGGIMTTGGGTMLANNLTIHTTGNSSAAIRSDRGGGTVIVDGGSYTTDGKGSPAIYSTADITVNNATLESTSAQGIVVEGKNSVSLNDTDVIASNVSKNSDKSDTYQAVMIYQSMSGDADEGEASFSMKGGTLTNANGDIFFVNNTVATITLEEANIINNDTDGYFLRAEAAGWGSEGSNGGHVTLQATNQIINESILVDDVSSINLLLNQGTIFTGSIQNDGEVYVELNDDAKWVLTGDSNITSLTCGRDAIDLNGFTLTVNGEVYQEGTISTGEAIVIEIDATSNHGMPGQDRPGTPPDGMGGGTPPDKPEGSPNENGGNTPPAKP